MVLRYFIFYYSDKLLIVIIVKFCLYLIFLYVNNCFNLNFLGLMYNMDINKN